MTTFEKLQQLDDGQFHQLADAVLKRLEPRYRDLRTHGLNDQGISIKGQPDSYVGNSAHSSTIAFCYTIDKADWWNKICEDATGALQASPNIQEIVIALPRDVDRQGPKDKKINWEERLRKITGKIPCIIYDGRKLSGLLDEKYQDVRYEHLEVPFSRLSSAAVVMSCNLANQAVIEDFKAKKRYDPQHYVPRQADIQLKQLWHEAFGSNKACRLIPVVNDSGLGKTSMLCSFTESVGASAPVLLMQARDLGFQSEDALVRNVIQKLQGVLPPVLQIQEEAALVQAVSSLGVLTIVLDGLDEVRNPLNVRRALKFWLESAIGRVSILIVSSRPDFWRRCSEKSWERWLVSKNSNNDASASNPDEGSRQPENRILGYSLPGQFSHSELRLAWRKFGLEENALENAPNDVRQELSHPLTLKAWVDIIKAGNPPDLPNTRDKIIELWLQSRLKQEISSYDCLSKELLWMAMIKTAKRIDAGGETCVSVDQLSGTPRFDPAHPPGEVVECLINANLLEFIEGQNDSIRFVLDTVYEFFLAEADLGEIKNDSQKVISSISEKTFSKTATRLGRLGHRIAGSPEGDNFARTLADRDYAKALVIIQGQPTKFSDETRRYIFDKCREVFMKSRRPEMAFLIERIGYVNCDEARDTLTSLALPWEHCPSGLHLVASYSIVRLNLISGISLLLEACWWFNGYRPYYIQSILSLLRNTSDEFKEEMVKYAMRLLTEPSGSQKHAQAVCIFGYLGDERLVVHLNERLQSNNGLHGYENHALFAVGTSKAAELFLKSATLTAAKVETFKEKNQEDAVSKLWSNVALRSADLRYLVTEPFEKCMISLMNGPNPTTVRFGVDLANSSRKSKLIRHLIFSGNSSHYSLVDSNEINKSVSTSDWLEWWGEESSKAIKSSLLRFAGEIPDIRIEKIAIDSLKIPELCGSAAHALARLGSIRCLPHVREAFDSLDIKASNAFYPLYGLVLTLGRLRDNEAIKVLERVVLDNPHTIRSRALDALAQIGTNEAADTLIKISSEVDLNVSSNNCVIESLIAHGSQVTVNRAIEIAKQYPEGPRWLVKQMRYVFMQRGLTVGKYYTHLNDGELIDYLMSGEDKMSTSERRNLIHCFEQIDSENVRRMLQGFANLAGTDKDLRVPVLKNDEGPLLSSEAREQLINRVDKQVLPDVITSILKSKPVIFSYQLERLAKYADLLIVSEVKTRLNLRPKSQEEIVRLLAILGIYGSPADVNELNLYLNFVGESVQNVSDETRKLLTDPLRLAEAWRENWFNE